MPQGMNLDNLSHTLGVVLVESNLFWLSLIHQVYTKWGLNLGCYTINVNMTDS